MTNLEVVQRAFAAFESGDLEGMKDILHPDAELRPLNPDLVRTDGPYRGYEGLEQWFVDLADTPRDFSGHAEKVIEQGDTVVVLGRIKALRPASGYSYGVEAGWVFELEDGVVKSFRAFPEQKAALEAAGLEG